MPYMLVPRQKFLTKGVGRHKERPQSFEEASRKAGIAAFNLVRVSSIFPSVCTVVARGKGLAQLQPEQVVFCVLADCQTNEPNRAVSTGFRPRTCFAV